MDKIKEKVAQFNDGLISEHEFLGHLIEIIGEAWQSSQMEALRFTRELADKLKA